MESISCVVEKLDSDVWGYHIVIPSDIAKQFIEGDNRRVVCHINDSLSTQSALMPIKGYYMILINKQVRDKLGLRLGSTVQIKLEKDKSKYGLPMPESFETLLAQDDEGRTYFEALTMGKQRALIHLVGKVKNIDSQLNKGLAIMDHLKESNGKLDFKRLNEIIKMYNNGLR
ncbi:MAG: YdeI/OmpD-associated family protein [Bacteroidota bacterium]